MDYRKNYSTHPQHTFTTLLNINRTNALRIRSRSFSTSKIVFILGWYPTRHLLLLCDQSAGYTDSGGWTAFWCHKLTVTFSTKEITISYEYREPNRRVLEDLASQNWSLHQLVELHRHYLAAEALQREVICASDVERLLDQDVIGITTTRCGTQTGSCFGKRVFRLSCAKKSEKSWKRKRYVLYFHFHCRTTSNSLRPSPARSLGHDYHCKAPNPFTHTPNYRWR